MRGVSRVIISAIALAAIGTASGATRAAQEPGPAAERTEEGLYLLRVVEPGYDVTIRETERMATYSRVEMNGLVPTTTAGGVVLFRAVHDIAKERRFEYTFMPPPGQGQVTGATSRGSDGRRVAVVTKVFLTNDAGTSLKELLGADYSTEAQQWFDSTGYRSVSELAVFYGGLKR